jgi:hypothetical protein
METQNVRIPKDVESSGNRGDLCYAEYYGKTREEVEQKAENYFAAYHPMGYGTFFKQPIQKHKDGYWFCRINRYHSCD